MAGVLGQLFRPQKKAMYRDPNALELEMAKEILAEIFKIKVSDVDEMIQSRFESACSEDIGSKENRLWPREFWLEG